MGFLAASSYDALVAEPWRCAELLPGARSVLVIGSGGRSLWSALEREGLLSPEVEHPVNELTRRALARLLASLHDEGHAAAGFAGTETRGGHPVDLVALARAAGLGAPSRLGLLLHPVVGPWLSIRAVALTDLGLPAAVPEASLAPCLGCPAPCLDACPGEAPRTEGFDLAACERGRAATPDCLTGCAARRACPVGAEHVYLPAAEAHHMRFRDAPGVPNSSRERG